MKYQFEIKEKTIKELIATLNVGLQRAKNSADETQSFKNGIGMGKYRYIYDSMMSTVNEDLMPIKLKYKGWDYTLYSHLISSSLMGIMSKNNFDLKSKTVTGVPHYMAVKSEYFNVQKNNFEDYLDDSQKPNLQNSFDFGEDPQVKKTVDDIFKNVDLDLDKIDKFILLVTDFLHDEVVGLEAKIINESFDVLYSEDWSQHIMISTQDGNEDAHEHQEAPQHDIKLPLRKGIFYSDKNNNDN